MAGTSKACLHPKIDLVFVPKIKGNEPTEGSCVEEKRPLFLCNKFLRWLYLGVSSWHFLEWINWKTSCLELDERHVSLCKALEIDTLQIPRKSSALKTQGQSLWIQTKGLRAPSNSSTKVSHSLYYRSWSTFNRSRFSSIPSPNLRLVQSASTHSFIPSQGNLWSVIL